MIVARPLTLTSSNLTDTNLFDTIPTAYSGATTYNDGDFVSVAQTYYNAFDIYESLAGSNAGNAVTATAWWEHKATLYGTYAGGTTYYPFDVVLYNGTLYQSLWQDVGSPWDNFDNENTGNTPDSSPTYWQEYQPANSLAAFDNTTDSKINWSSQITLEITTTGYADCIGLIGLAGITDVNLVVTEDTVEILDEDYDLIEGVGDWWDYFSAPFQTSADLPITDLMALDVDTAAALVLTFTLSGPGAMSVAGVVMGKGRTLGDTQHGMEVSIVDHSRVVEDDFGVRDLVRRNYVKAMRSEVWADADQTSYVFATLAALRATPILAIGATQYRASTQLGLIKSWRERLAYPSHSILDIDMQGL